MTDKKITQLTALTGANAVAGDQLAIVDVSDTTMSASGTTKKIALSELQAAPLSAGTANGVAYLNGSKVLTTGSALTFDGSNLGLGVTPSAWGSVYKAVQNRNTTFYDAGNYGWSGFLFNAYHDNTNARYVSGNRAGEYRFDVIGGTHSWFTAPSGTAGDPISFTQAMTLNASGNLGIGTSSPGTKLEVANGDLRVSQSGTGNIGINLVRTSGTTADWYNYLPSGSADLVWYKGDELMRLDSSGNLGLGVTAPADKLEIGGSGAGIILASPNGTRYRVTVSNLGVLTVAAV
jgi:hypothetical protein